MKFRTLTAIVAAGAACVFATQANAAFIQFTVSQLTSMTVNAASTGFTAKPEGSQIKLKTAAPAGDYTDGVPMTGSAGATGNLNPLIPGPIGDVLYQLSAADLTTFKAAVSAGDILTMNNFNDNNQPWEIGVWYQDASGFHLSGATIAAGFSAPTSIVLPTGSSIIEAGVFVESVISQPDDYHASWAQRPTADLPEPASFVIWGGLLALGGVLSIRRRQS